MSPDASHSPLGALARLSNARSRSISAENKTGEKGRGGMATVESTVPMWEKQFDGVGGDKPAHPSVDLGQGWKVEPFTVIAAGETVTLADIEGPGAIEQIWMT